MSILKKIGEIFKPTFKDNPFVKAFMKEVDPPKDNQKEIAENTKAILEELKKGK